MDIDSDQGSDDVYSDYSTYRSEINWREEIKATATGITEKVRYWTNPEIRPFYKHLFIETPEELEQQRARDIQEAQWFKAWDPDFHTYPFIRHQKAMDETVRVMWYPSADALNAEPYLQSIFPLESDGWLDLTQVMKKFKLVNCIPIDCRRGITVRTGDPNRMSPLALHSLVDDYNCLRVTEDPPEPLKAIRHLRKEALAEYRYRRWQLKYEAEPYLRETFTWWRQNPIQSTWYCFWVFMTWFYSLFAWTAVPLWFLSQLLHLPILLFRSLFFTTTLTPTHDNYASYDTLNNHTLVETALQDQTIYPPDPFPTKIIPLAFALCTPAIMFCYVYYV